MILFLLLPFIAARGPPGILPPLSFVAESWYPSNLPTVQPPWKEPGVDINQFRTQEISENSVTQPIEETTRETVKKKLLDLDFQQDGITEILNSTDKSVEEGSGEILVDTKLISANDTLTVETTTVTDKTIPMEGTITTSRELQEENTEEEGRIPFHGEDVIFEVTEKSKIRGEGGIEKKKDKKDCSDLIFVIDSSGNVVSQFDKQKKMIRQIILALGQQKRRLGLITYSNHRKQRWNISPKHNVSRELYLKKLKKARFLGGVTATGAVLKFIATETVETRSTVVLLTDGFSFDEVDEAAEDLRNIKTVDLYVTGDYFPIVKNVLNVIAGDAEHMFFGSGSIDRLIELLKC